MIIVLRGWLAYNFMTMSDSAYQYHLVNVGAALFPSF